MEPQRLRLYLVRHGATDANLEMRYLGRTDAELNRQGRRQARQLGERLAESPFAAIITSPMARARATAEAIADAAGRPIRIEPRLAEMDFGEWEGMTRDEVLASSGDAPRRLAEWERDPNVAPPGGEAMSDVLERCLALVGGLRNELAGQEVALVSHVGPLKALLCAALDLPLSATRRLFMDPATVSVVDWSERPVVRLFNAHGHQGWAEARWMRDVHLRR